MSVTQSSTERILNPDVYHNHFSPADAHEEEIRRDVIMALVGVILWDVFAYIPSDIKIIRESQFRSTVLSFIVSRVMTVVYIIIIKLMLPGAIPVDSLNLKAMWYSAAIAIVFVLIASSYLFLRRVLAVYSTEKWVQRCFVASWIILSTVSGIVIPLGGKPALFPGTKYYKGAKMEPWFALYDWGLLAFDTAVVVAISLKLGRQYNTEYHNNDNDNRVSWYSFLTGRHLPRFARALLRGGQQYYMMTVGLMILVGTTIILPMMPLVYKDLLTIFFFFFSASMACRVFRNMKFFDCGAVNSLPDERAL